MAEPLRSYLNDHLAGANFAINLLERMCKTHLDDDTGAFAKELLVEIQQDATVLRDLIDQVGGAGIGVKEMLGWLSEHATRAKLRMTAHSLGLFEAWEALALGVLGKLSLWRALAVVRDSHAAVRALDLEYLAKRAEAQYADIERERLDAAMKALQ
jgi:hypothetical protein